MNADMLLQHFDRISEAPDAVARLRRFILDLAARGKLVKQDSNDEPASELLKRIQMEKGLRKKNQEQSKSHNFEETFDLPANWSSVLLITLGTWAIGTGFPKNEQGNKEGPLLFLKVSDMNLPGNEKYIHSAQNYIDEMAIARMRAKVHPPGTIIFPKIGGAIATNKRRILLRPSAIDNNCLGITFNKEINIEWAYLLLTTLNFAQYQVGTAVPALQQSILEKIPVGLPPLPEQHRIVAKVEELMALCDQLQAARDEREAQRDRVVAASLHRIGIAPLAAVEGQDVVSLRDAARFHLDHLTRFTTRPEHVRQLRQTILNLAVRGRLVKQISDCESVSDLFNRIGIKPCNDMPFPIPESWSWITVGQIAITRLGKMLDKAKNRGKPRRYLRNVNVRWFDFDLSDVAEMLFEDDELEEFTLRRGDVLVCEGGEPGRAAVWDGREDEIYFQKAIHRIRFIEGVDPYFFVNALRESANSRRLHTYFTGVGIKHFTGKGLASFVFPLPPIEEQRRIAKAINELMALCDQLETQLTNIETGNQRLLEAVLRDALVPGSVFAKVA